MSSNSCLPYVAIALLLTACEKPFEPFAPTDLVFSIYGHLDAAADTQWVRVMALRDGKGTQAGPIDAVVTLEEIETGATVVLSDSVFRYLPLFPGDPDQYAHNFSTTMPIVPGRQYRLTATRSDGASASATVVIPTFRLPTLVVSDRFSFPNSTTNNSMPLPAGTISGTAYLGMVLGREDIPEICNWPHPIHQEFLLVTRPATPGEDDHDVQLAWPQPPGPRPSYVPGPPPECRMEPKRILAIASGEPWPYGSESQLRELLHPAAINTIEGRGLGFLAGVFTHVFPFARCTPLERANACTITFSPLSATLAGVVTNGCTKGPMSDVLVRLQAPSSNAIRYDTTDVSGTFQFQGLDPDAPHSLRLEQLLPPREFFAVELENVAVPEATIDTLSVEMTLQRNCPP